MKTRKSQVLRQDVGDTLYLNSQQKQEQKKNVILGLLLSNFFLARRNLLDYMNQKILPITLSLFHNFSLNDHMHTQNIHFRFKVNW